MLLPPELLEGRIGMIGTTGLGLLPKMPEISPEMDDRIEPALLLLPDPLHDEAGLDGWAWLALLLPELPHDTLGLDGLDDLAGAGLLEPNKLHAMAGLVVRMQATTVATVAMRFTGFLQFTNDWLTQSKACAVPIADLRGS
jgi:hypothetical protein